jgi:glycosyltransferase involved in cell wall biosynthesis
MVSQQTINDYKTQYRRLHTPPGISEKIIYVPNGIKLPDSVPQKNFNVSVYDALFVGRGTPEKRVRLVARIAEKAKKESLPLRFVLAGDVKNSIPAGLDSYCSFLGTITNEKQLQDIYSKSHFLILTSIYEGFPLVVMEAMAMGLIILSTPVGDIPFHIKENENGFLFDGPDDESITGNALNILKNISGDPQHLAKISATNIIYAKNNFAIEQFNDNYRKLLR